MATRCRTGAIPAMRFGAALRAGLVACLALAALAGRADARTAPPAGARIIVPGSIVLSATHINLVGRIADASVPGGWRVDSTTFGAKLTVTVYSQYGYPLPGCPVLIDFSGCTSDLRVASWQGYHDASTYCPTPYVQGFTTLNGTVSFVIAGAAVSRNDHPAGCAAVYADSYPGGHLAVAAYDQDGIGGMTLADIALVWGDLMTNRWPERSDFDGNGYVTLSDVGYAWTVAVHPFDSCPTYCP